ncbi:MAG: RrF2 family transcriptional regulator [Mycoplasmatales bacterium]
MEIKKKTHYTIKVLIHLALHEQNNNYLIDIKEVSDELVISYEHTRKIIQDLVKLNAVKSVRGRNGGIKLNKDTKDIHIYDLIISIEDVNKEDFEHDCANCNMPLDCKFKHMLKDNYKQFFDNFKSVYLSDLL